MSITSEDLIFYKDGDKVYSGGFSVNSVLLKKGGSPFITLNNQYGGDYNKMFSDENLKNSNNVSDLFKNFVVPSGLLYLPNKENYICEKEEYIYENDDNNSDDEYITDDIHDRLIQLVSKDNQKLPKGGSKKFHKPRNKNTKKYKKI
jgi:hypothetical protein